MKYFALILTLLFACSPPGQEQHGFGGSLAPQGGTITSVTPTSGGGLAGGGGAGAVQLGLLTSCNSGESMIWGGSSWACGSSSGGVNPDYGTGIDGTVVFDGTSTILGITPSGMAYTLPRDVMPAAMAVNSGVTINTAGFRIFVKGTLSGAGTIQDVGAAASGQTPGSGRGAGLSVGGNSGGSGGNSGCNQGGAGTASNRMPIIYTTNNVEGQPGANGGAGTAGGTSAGGGGGGSPGCANGNQGGTTTTSSAAGIPTFPDWRIYAQGANAQNTNPSSYTLATGGGGAGGGTGAGGGGGAGGGFLFIAANTLAGSVTYSVAGGVGASGPSCNNNSNPCGGGGGGGGGGYLIIEYAKNNSTSTFSAAGGAGGAGGVNSGTAGSGTSGGAGGTGLVLLYGP